MRERASREAETVSGKHSWLSIAANQNGVAAVNQMTIEGSESFPPIKGPIIKPKPNAAPRRPTFFARCSGGVTSAITPWATGMFPPVTPSNPLAKKRRGMFLVTIPRAKIMCEMHVPVTDIPSSFLLPYLSESCPRIGAARNWHSG